MENSLENFPSNNHFYFDIFYHFPIKHYVSTSYKKSLKFAEISPKNILLLKIVRMSAEKCQFRGQKIT
jgi:hypothetical protein